MDDKNAPALDLSTPHRIRDLLKAEDCIEAPQQSVARFVETVSISTASGKTKTGVIRMRIGSGF